MLPVIAPGGVAACDRALMPGWTNATHAFDFEGADTDCQSANFIAELKKTGRQPRPPYMAPAMPEGFVARPEEFAKLKTALLNPDTKEAVAITAALRGAGGFGKTVLAQALVHDDDIQDAFHDGVLWVTLGERPSLIEKLADLLKTLTGEPQGFTEVSAAANKLREVLAERKCLLVIDDVWSEGHLRAFTDGAPLTARLVTTRNPELPREAAVRIVVDKMTAGEALALLQRGLPAPGRDEDAALAKLATEGLRNWPILIGIVNGILSRYTSGDHPEPLATAIETVASKLDADGVLGFDAATETDRNMSVSRTIEVGLDVLDVLDATPRKGGVTYPADYHRAIGSSLLRGYGNPDYDHRPSVGSARRATRCRGGRCAFRSPCLR